MVVQGFFELDANGDITNSKVGIIWRFKQYVMQMVFDHVIASWVGLYSKWVNDCVYGDSNYSWTNQ